MLVLCGPEELLTDDEFIKNLKEYAVVLSWQTPSHMGGGASNVAKRAKH